MSSLLFGHFFGDSVLVDSLLNLLEKALCVTAAIGEPLPCLHDIRHSFAVQCVLAWYRANRDVNTLLPALSTYLGHVSVENTRVYLQANGLLLDEANQRFSTKTAQLDEVLS